MLDDIYSVKILLVEDFKVTRRMEIEALNELGFDNIVEAGDGKSAVLMLSQAEDIGLIISDWNMPNMNGYELLLHVRSDENFKDIPFIMATAQGAKKEATKAIKGGADHFIIKPFTPLELKEVIENVFTWRKEAAEPEYKSVPKKTTITVAHIQITDHLVLGVLKHLIATEQFCPKYFELKTKCMPSWNPVQNSLERREVDAAFMLAPLAMDLFNFGTPIKLVLFSHRNGSICVKNKQEISQESLHNYLKSRIFFLPHTMSVHHMLSDMFLSEIGLKLGPVGKPGVDVFFEVVPPARMPEFLRENSEACGFVVAEPFGTKAISTGISDLMFLSGELWENHPCCVVAMHQDFVEKHTDAVHEFVHMLVQAGNFIDHNPKDSAVIAINFLDPHRKLGLTIPLLENILIQPAGIKTDDLFPVIEDLDRIQRYMSGKMGIGEIIDLEKFVDTRFAQAAYKGIPETRMSKIHDPASIVTKIVGKQITRRRPDVLHIRKNRPDDVFQMTRDEKSVSFQICSDMKLVSRIVQETKAFVTGFGFESFSGLNLILRELLNNAVEHGNKNTESKKIFCTVTNIRDSLFKIVVKDEGEGFDYTSLDMTMPEDKNQVRRRGYPFISAFTEEIEFNTQGNQVTVYHVVYNNIRFHTTIKGEHMVIRPSGDITATEINEFRSLLKNLTQKGYVKYCFDFSKVQDIDSVGLSAFIVLSKMLADKDADLEITNACPDIAELFRMTHLDESYRISQAEC
ncbi:MAG: ABC transporter substrate-binding protein [Desulfobacteraceae bacterium]|nr:ABC transporter substrate-binding protein [Desulfobacteraceae bacterium]